MKKHLSLGIVISIVGISFVGMQQAGAADISAAVPKAATVPFFYFADTQVSLRYEFNGREPGVGPYPDGYRVPKKILGITHFDVWKYGTNYALLDILKSTDADPPARSATFDGEGALQFYTRYRGTLSGNAMSGGKAFGAGGVVKDLSLGYGFDWEHKDTAYGSRTKDLVIGPNISFNVPGVFTAQANVYKEWNHCGLQPYCTAKINYRASPEIEFVYMHPLDFLGLPLRFEGFTYVIAPRGKNGFGYETATEMLSSNRLVLDLGKLFGGKAGVVDGFVGYKYWFNKFGYDHNNKADPGASGAIERTFYLGVAAHVF